MSDQRLWALVPLLGLVVMTVHNVRVGTPGALLWVCNVCTLMVALGLVLHRPMWVKTASLWLIVGAPFWILDSVITGDWLVHSFITHLVSPALGLRSLRREPATGAAWWRSLAVLVALTQIARVATPRELNVNAGHDIYGPVRSYFDTYLGYWVFNFVSFGLGLFVVERVLDRLWLQKPR